MERVDIYTFYSLEWDSLDGNVTDGVAVRGGLGNNDSARFDIVKLHSVQRLITACSGAARGMN